MASQKEYTMLFALNASLNSSFQTAFGRANQSIQGLQKEINALAKEQANISAYEKQMGAVERTSEKLELYKSQLENLKSATAENAVEEAKLANAILAKEKQISDTSGKLDEQTDKLNKMGSALEEAGVDTSNLAGESRRLGEEMARLKREQDQAAESAESFGDQAAAAFSAVSSAILAAGIADKIREIGGAYMETVKTAANFEASMSQVAATMGLGSGDVENLSEYAKKMGASTSFSAQQAAEGLNILAMAGLNATDQIAGLPTVLDLAAAGGMDLAETASYVTGAVKGFGDNMGNAGYYADLMAKGATLANTNVAQLGEAFSGSAASAKNYGQSADSVTLSLLRLAEQNVTGTEASTALNRAMQDLFAMTKKDAREAFKELDVALYEANGDARDFNDIIDEMQAALSGYTQEQANALKSTIFTTQGMAAFNKMTASTGDRVQELWKGIGEAGGSASQQAATQLDNMNGELTIMQSAAEGLSISLGELYKDDFRELYAAGTEVLTMLNQFVKENPGLVKGIITSGTALGGLTTAITGVAAASKALAAVQKAMQGAQLAGMALPGVGEIMAVVAAVSALSGAVAYFYETSDMKAVRDMTTEARDLEKSMRQLHSAYEDTSADNLATAETARMFIDRLRELEVVGQMDDQQKQEYHNTLELLKATMPELADKIDTVNDSIEGGLPAIEAAVTDWQKLAEQQAKQEFAAELQQELASALKEQMRNEQQLSAARKTGEIALENQSAAYNRLLSALGMTEEQFKSYYGTVQDIPWRSMSQEVQQARNDYLEYGKQVREAETDQRRHAAALEQSEPLIAQAQNDIATYTGALEQANGELAAAGKLQLEVNNGMGQIGPVIDNAKQSLESLMETYQEAYDEALKSIQGQYALWDDVAKVSAVSADTINQKIEKQTEYWQEYNSNLEALRARTGDIEGLGEVISSFADGSADSVNAIAGMASASDEDLAAMVQNYQDLQKAQEETSESIGALAADFDQQTDEIAQYVEEMVSDMNLEAEAKAAAISTLNGYIAGLREQSGPLSIAFGQIYSAARSGLSGSGAPAIGKGYASGTDYATPGLHWVGEDGPELMAMRGGEKVIPHDDSLRLISSMGDRERPNISAPISIVIEGNASKETEMQIYDAAEKLKESVIEIMIEQDFERRRRSMTPVDSFYGIDHQYGW